MKVLKVINNNIVSSTDENNREIIVMGRGLGFGRKAGSIIDETKIEKIFRMDSRGEIKQLEDLLADVPIEVVQLVNKIVDKASIQIEDKLQKSIYITLMDHINFAIERKRQNILFQNPLFYDVKRLYKTEYRIGQEAVKYINKTLNTDLPEEEAAAIALHLINARLGKEMPETISITKIVQSTIKIVQYFFNIEIVEDMPEADYFVLYIKHLAERIMNHEMLQVGNDEVDYMIRKTLVKSSECAKRITDYIFKEYGVKVPPAETTDLILKIERIVTQNETSR